MTARNGARTRPEAGVAVVDALVALGLTGVALAGLAGAAAASVRHLRLARERSVAVALATNRLEALRAGPRGDGRDEPDLAGTPAVRTWSSDGGHGDVARLHVEVVWPGGSVRLESEAFP